MSDSAPPSSANGTQPPGAPQDGTDASDAPERGSSSLAKPPAPAKDAASTGPRRWKMNLEGEEREYDEDTIRANYLKGRSSAQMLTKAEQRLKAASEAEERSKSLPEKFRKDARKALQELGLNPREVAEALLLPDIQREMMTGEQRELAEHKSKLAEYEAKDKEREDQERATKDEQLEREYKDYYGSRAKAALERVGIPKESAPWAVKRMAALMDKTIDLGIDLTADDIASLVKEDFQGEHRAFRSGLSDDQLVDWLGDEDVARVVKQQIRKLKSRQSATGFPAPGATSATKPGTPQMNGAKRKYLTMDEFDAEIKRRAQE